MFGHPLTLYFNQQGGSHNTAAGGFVSILVKILMAIYVILKFQRLVLREGAGVLVSGMLLKVDLLGEVPLGTTHLVAFHTIRKQRTGLPVFLNDPEMQRYLDIYYLESRADFNKPRSQRYTNVRHDAVQCGSEHFGNSTVQ